MTIGVLRAAAWRRHTASAFGSAAALALVFTALVAAAPPALAQFSQQGSTLVGSGYIGTPGQGFSVGLSGDGNTAIVSGYTDNSNVGAAWVFTRSGGAWTQQAELTASDESGAASLGYSVALSADGNTAIIGGDSDNSNVGAAWIFTRSNGIWTQQGSKLTASDETGTAFFGFSVGLSLDGTTAIVGGPNDNGTIGAAWIFTGSGGTWTQQGGKLVASDETGDGLLGKSAALSADGNTAIIGGDGDNNNVGAAWIFTRSNGTWSQQGSKLVGSGYVYGAIGAGQGGSVALSGNGNTAIIGGPTDNSSIGAVWIFTQSGGLWTQQGSKLVGEYSGNPGQGDSVALSTDGNTAIWGGAGDEFGGGATWVFSQTGGVWTEQGFPLNSSGASGQGFSVALSADGNTAISGAPGDSSGIGAAWVFVRTVPTNSHDFDDDGVSDILWLDTSGDLATWLMSGGQFSSGAELGNVGTTWSVVGSRDFNGDGDADMLWLDQTGDVALWLMNGTSVSSYGSLGNVGTQWTVAGTGDFNGDGTGDILWRNTTTGDTAIWLMSNGAFSSGVDLGAVALNWHVAGTGDFNGDGTTDILWRNNSNGELAIWFMSNGQLSSSLNVGRVSLDWSVVGTGDFNGDGVSDILWRDSEGDLAIWLMDNAGQMASGTQFSGIPTTWSVAETGDFDGDGKSDILWIDQSGDLGVWLMNGLTVSSALGLGNVGTSWKVQGKNAD